MLCHVSVHRVHRARDPISVAFFDQITLFSDFNHLFELLGPGFAPYSSKPFIYSLYWNKAQKKF